MTMQLRALLDRASVRRKLSLSAGLIVMVLAVVHTLLPGEPVGSDWLGLALYLCGAVVTVLAAIPLVWPQGDRSRQAG